MSTRDITLTWDDPNLIEQGNYVYRSNVPMDINNLPIPISTVNGNSNVFVDTNRDEFKLYYRVGAFIDGNIMVSEEFVINPTFEFITDKEIIQVGDSTQISINMKDGLAGDSVYWSLSGTLPLEYITSDITGSFNFVENPNILAIDTLLYFADDKTSKNIIFNLYRDITRSHLLGSISIQVDMVTLIPQFLYFYKNTHLFKKDNDGQSFWQNTMPSGINSMAVDSGNNVLVTTNDSLFKYDSNGSLVWSKNNISSYSLGGVTVDQNDNIYVSGWRLFISYDASGAKRWDKNSAVREGLLFMTASNGELFAWDRYAAHFAKFNLSYGNKISIINNIPNGKTIVANNFIYVLSGWYVQKYTLSGSLEWSLSYSSNTDSMSIPRSITVDNLDNVYVGRGSTSNGYVAKLDVNGNLIWETFIHSGYVTTISVDVDGFVYTGSRDGTLKTLDYNGNEIWSHDPLNGGFEVTNLIIKEK